MRHLSFLLDASLAWLKAVHLLLMAASMLSCSAKPSWPRCANTCIQAPCRLGRDMQATHIAMVGGCTHGYSQETMHSKLVLLRLLTVSCSSIMQDLAQDVISNIYKYNCSLNQKNIKKTSATTKTRQCKLPPTHLVLFVKLTHALNKSHSSAQNWLKSGNIQLCHN